MNQTKISVSGHFNLKLIIFDCDGTLVDSECLYNQVTARLLNEIGYDEYTPGLCSQMFTGMAWSAILSELEIRHQTKMPDAIVQRYMERSHALIESELRAAHGAQETLECLKQTYEMCVASNGERGNVLNSLRVTDLMRHFTEATVFTKNQVARPKPAPDLFLFACSQMGYKPQDALVIEDSVTGVRAAVAAAIRVLGYTGTAHNPEKAAENLKNAGAGTIINELTHIRKHLE